jgi:multiple sugar transport system permease protein
MPDSPTQSSQYVRPLPATPLHALGRYLAREQVRWGIIFVLPSVIFFLLFVAYPVLYSFYLGFHDWNPLDPEPTYVGFANYHELVTSLTFLRTLLNTVVFVVGAVTLMIVGSIASALALNQGIRALGLFRGIYYSPVVTSFVATAIIWLWLFDPQFGPINQMLGSVGLPKPGWTADRFWAMPTVILTFVWREVGYFTVIYLAGLQGIPQELKDAARIDGANARQVFRNITLPLLIPTTIFVLVIGTLRAMQNSFAVIWVMTAGGPVEATNVLVVYMFQNAFAFFRLGYASAVAWFIFVLVFGLTLLQFRLIGRRGEGSP